MMKSNTAQIYSDLAGDPDLADLLHEFVCNLAIRQQSLRDHLQRGEEEPLTRIIHQLKGACGGYGFHTLTDAAHIIEEQLRQGRSINELREQIENFIDSLSLVRSTTPS